MPELLAQPEFLAYPEFLRVDRKPFSPFSMPEVALVVASVLEELAREQEYQR